jgi:hypothetical protein
MRGAGGRVNCISGAVIRDRDGSSHSASRSRQVLRSSVDRHSGNSGTRVRAGPPDRPKTEGAVVPRA